MNLIRDRREHAEVEGADGAGGGALGRRAVLGGLAAIPVLYGVGSAASAQAAQAATVPKVASGVSGLVRGLEQRYSLPLLVPGTRLVLPAGIKAVAVKDYYRRPYLASSETLWPRVAVAGGGAVDASVVPEHGAATRVAVLSGFRPGQGWFELIFPSKGADRRVTWDAARFPFLFIHGEFGGAGAAPFDRFFSLALQPLSGNPYPRTASAR